VKAASTCDIKSLGILCNDEMVTYARNSITSGFSAGARRGISTLYQGFVMYVKDVGRLSLLVDKSSTSVIPDGRGSCVSELGFEGKSGKSVGRLSFALD
jgi:hypothetical protein